MAVVPAFKQKEVKAVRETIEEEIRREQYEAEQEALAHAQQARERSYSPRTRR
jgi:hypothetical protein